MEQDFIFRSSFIVLEILSSIHYVTWPLYLLGAVALILNRFRSLAFLNAVLRLLWYLLTITGILLILGLLIALMTAPKNDGGAGLMFYAFFLMSLPILIPCVLAFFFKPD